MHAIHCGVRDVDLGRDEEVGHVLAVRDAVGPPIDVADPTIRRRCVNRSENTFSQTHQVCQHCQINITTYNWHRIQVYRKPV